MLTTDGIAGPVLGPPPVGATPVGVDEPPPPPPPAAVLILARLPMLEGLFWPGCVDAIEKLCRNGFGGGEVAVNSCPDELIATPLVPVVCRF